MRFIWILQWEQTGRKLAKIAQQRLTALPDMEWTLRGSLVAVFKRLCCPAPTLLIMSLAWKANLCKIAHLRTIHSPLLRSPSDNEPKSAGGLRQKPDAILICRKPLLKTFIPNYCLSGGLTQYLTGISPCWPNCWLVIE
jgi:hypothetical protein